MANAGTVTVTRAEQYGGGRSIIFTWTSSSGSACELDGVPIYGTLCRLVTNPGTSAPTDDYGITIVDSVDAVDALQGKGANRDTANTEEVFIYKEQALTSGYTALPVVVAGLYNFVLASMGASTSGTATIFYK